MRDGYVLYMDKCDGTPVTQADIKIGEIFAEKLKDIKYMCNIRNANELIEVEKLIDNRCKETETIKSKSGQSTLINYLLVVIDGLKRAFSKREVNIWDIVQSAYLVEKAGGKIMYEDGSNIFPLDMDKCMFEDNKLILPFTIAGNNEIKNILRSQHNRTL